MFTVLLVTFGTLVAKILPEFGIVNGLGGKAVTFTLNVIVLLPGSILPRLIPGGFGFCPV